MAWLREFGRVIYESTELKGPGYRVRSALLGRQSWPGALSSCSTRFPTESGSTIPGAGGRRVGSAGGASRVVGEFEVSLPEGDRTFGLPLAVVVEPDTGSRRVWIRIYHSQWPLFRRHLVRPPFLGK